MVPLDPALAGALCAQLERRQATLRAGARPVGWKLGLGDRERIGSGPVIGHLTTATQLAPGATYHAGMRAGALHADAEIAVEVARDVAAGADTETCRAAIAGYGAALEIVDLAAPPDDPRDIVAANVFHRAFAIGPRSRSLPAGGVVGRLVVDGRERASAPATADLAALVGSVAGMLAALGERLRAGELIITGSVVQVPVAPGHEVLADLGSLGRVALGVAP